MAHAEKKRTRTVCTRMFYVLLLACISCTCVKAQYNMDSLRRAAAKTRQDTSRARSLYLIAEGYITARQYDSSLFYLEKSLNVIEKSLPAAGAREKKTLYRIKAMDLFGKGNIRERELKSAEAEQLYKQSLDINKNIANKKGMAELYKKLGTFYRSESRYDEALANLEQSLALYEQINDRLGISQCYMFMADAWRDKSQYNAAIDYYNKAIALKKELRDYKSMANAENNLGYVYNMKGEIKQALDHYYKSLRLREQINDRYGMGLNYINTGDIYFKQGDTLRGLENFEKALSIGENIQEKRLIAGASMYLGFYQQSKKQYDKALELYNRTLRLREEIKDKPGQAYCLFNMSKIYMDKGDTATASEKFNRAYELWKATGDKRGIASSLNYMGEAYLKKNDFKKAGELADEALAVASQAGIREQVRLAHLLRSKIALASGEYRQAYYAYEKAIGIRDSLVNQENKKAALEKDLEYQYEKKQSLLMLEKEKQDIRYREELKRKQLLFDLEVEKENSQHALEKKELSHREELKRKQLKAEFEKTREITRMETEKQQLLAEAKSRQQRNIIAMVSVGLLLVLVFLVLLFNRFRLIKKQKAIIESQKQQVEHQHAEISEQKMVLEEKNREILDSINYARRLQEAILPPLTLWNQLLPQSFILYKPKDIVAGDFYFMETSGSKIIFGAADCTGHGVPGAMVSVVCSNALTRAIKEFNITDPGTMLDKVRELVMETFSKSESDVKDGMDISLCVLDRSTGTLQWAGANNPLWLFGQDGAFTEIKPDKQPVGKSPDPRPFTSHTVNLRPGDMLYLFTDGYADQFGGSKGKKFKSANLRELIAGNLGLDIRQQVEAISKAFEQWRGDLEQVDDVCIIGIKL